MKAREYMSKIRAAQSYAQAEPWLRAAVEDEEVDAEAFAEMADEADALRYAALGRAAEVDEPS